MTMMPRSLLILFILLAYTTFCFGQSGKNKSEIEGAMDKYNRRIISMNIDSIASSYTEDGDLGAIAHGRDSIRRFLMRFSRFKVLSQTSTTDSITIKMDTAFQTGKYMQTVIVAPRDTVMVKGSFKIRWIWQQKDSWLIKSIETTPIR